MNPRRFLSECIVFLAGLVVSTSMVSGVSDQPAKKAINPHQLPLGNGIRAVAFSPDGALLAAALGEPKERGRVVVWDVPRRKQLWSHQEKVGIPAVAFSPDGKTLAIGVYDRTAKHLEVETGRVLKVFQGHKEIVRAVAFSPDGKTLAAGCWDHTVKLWDLATGRERRTLRWPGERLFALSFSPGGQWLLASGGDDVHVWDSASGLEKRTLAKPGFYYEWSLFADDRWFLTGDNHGTVRAWSVAGGEERVRFHDMPGVFRLAFSPLARRLAVATHFDNAIRVFDFTLQEPAAKEKERFHALLTKLDDDDYAVREASGKEILALGFVIEPELRRTMKETQSAEVRIRCRGLRQQLLSKPRGFLSGHTDQVEGLAFSPDGRLLASGSRDGTVRLWNVKELKETARLVPAVPK